MHFFYLDESGDTGKDYENTEQPIMVLGGISLRDEGWNTTQSEFDQLLTKFFGEQPPADFELHAQDLLSPSGDGPFAGMPMEKRCGLVRDVISLIETRKHSVHFVGIDKKKLIGESCGAAVPFDATVPYLIAFDYMLTFVNWYVKERLGSTARGMMIVDEKREYHDHIERIVHDRRRGGAATHRLKWVVEFTYPVDSKKNPMIQLSDLCIYIIRRFLELDAGYRDTWPSDAKKFYAEAYDRLVKRVPKLELVERGGQAVKDVNRLIGAVRYLPAGQWRKRHGLT